MRRLPYFLSCLVVAGTLWILLAPTIASRLVVHKPLDQADAIIVLSGSAAYLERTRKAAELYNRGVARQIWITDDGGRAGWSQDEQTNLTFVELERRALVGFGVAPDAIIVLPGTVDGTIDEARTAAAEVEKHGTKRLLIVTSAYHTRRALWTFERVRAGRELEIGITSQEFGNDSSGPWWLSGQGWQAVVPEYVKSVVYAIRY